MRLVVSAIASAACFVEPAVMDSPGFGGEPGGFNCLQVSPMRVDLAGIGDTRDITLAPNPECGVVGLVSVRLDDPDSAFLWTADFPSALEGPVNGRIELQAEDPGTYEAQLIVEPDNNATRVSVQISGEIDADDTDDS
jgi:hypothetical protein